MGRAALIVVPIVLGVYALIDCLTSDRSQVRGLAKSWWVVIVVLVPMLGPLAWLVAGRPKSRPRPTRRRPQTLAPDDDPEFLRKIRTLDEEHEALLEQWERDKRRREGTGPAAAGPPPAVPPAGKAGEPPAATPAPAADDSAGPGRDAPPGGTSHEETTPEASPPDRDRDDDGTAV